MYQIIASDMKDGAILRKEDGKLCYSSLWMQGMRVTEEDLQGFREGAVEGDIEDGYVPHVPPTIVEKLEDWPKAATEYEEHYRKTHTTVAP